MIDASNMPKIAAVFAIVAFGVYRRVRRNIGRRFSLPGGSMYAWASLRFYAWCWLFCIRCRRWPWPTSSADSSSAQPSAGSRCVTRQFEATAEGYFYIPHLYIGIAVTALFVGAPLVPSGSGL